MFSPDIFTSVQLALERLLMGYKFPIWKHSGSLPVFNDTHPIHLHMPVNSISKPTFNFLSALKAHNNRTWFNDHKEDYQSAHAEMVAFAESLIAEMNTHDVLETTSGKKSLFRIYRDIRFSKDKTPYKAHFSGSMVRAGKLRRGGYYFHVEPGNCFIAGGFWGPNANDLRRIRQEIDLDAAPLRALITAPDFTKAYGSLQGEQLKTAPRGFAKDHPEVDLLRYKQMIVTRNFSDQEAMKPGFAKKMSDAFQPMRPFLDFMSEVLTTDINGVPLDE
jgi:uncharacterized protein (TIGR02453 family)